MILKSLICGFKLTLVIFLIKIHPQKHSARISVISILSYLYSRPDPTQKSLEINTNNEYDQSQSNTVKPPDVSETEQNATLILTLSQ